MRQRKVPQRKCLGCNEMFSKKELIRVVKCKTGEEENIYEISLDLTGKKSGRGAYVCKNLQCLQKARKAKRIEKALECVIPEEVYDRMEQELKESE